MMEMDSLLSFAPWHSALKYRSDIQRYRVHGIDFRGPSTLLSKVTLLSRPCIITYKDIFYKKNIFLNTPPLSLSDNEISSVTHYRIKRFCRFSAFIFLSWMIIFFPTLQKLYLQHSFVCKGSGKTTKISGNSHILK